MGFRVVILDGPEGPGEVEERELAAVGATVDRSGTRPGSDHRALVGFGNIGRRVAKRTAGFGLRVLAHTPRLTDEIAREHGAERCSLTELFERSDYVSLHLPAGPATRHLIEAATLAYFKPTAWL